MMNEYQYKGQELNPLIAKKCILELFSGKSAVPRKSIIDTVDETHFQLGGKRSKNPVSTVRMALKNLVREGKATQPETGYYSIHPHDLSEQPEPVDEGEVNKLRSAIENEVEFIGNQIKQLENRKSELLHKINEL